MYRNLTRNAAVSVLQTLLSGVVLFLLYRYLINNLGAEQLGLWSVILASTSVARLSDLGLTGSVVKFVARYRALNDAKQAAEVVQTAAISIASAMAVLILMIYPLLDDVLKLSIPVDSMPQALNILPWAALSLWLGSVGGVFQSGLDGCQRMDIRNILMIFGNLIFFGGALWLVPHYGLVGLAMGQAAQGLLLIVVSWLMLRRQLKSLPWLPVQWSRVKFKEMLGYSVNFQISSIAILLFDPITKLLMSRYGGLSTAAYYEMANQLVVKLRSLIIAASQALVPTVAELHETSPEKVRDLYLKAYRLLFFVVVPFYATILISLPIVSVLWIGYSETSFLIFGLLLTVGWGLNNLNGPAYFLNLGIGSLKWNSISHVVTAILNVVLGFILGRMFGGVGVAISAMVALVIGSMVVIISIHYKYKIKFNDFFPLEHRSLLFSMAGAVIFSWFMSGAGQSFFGVIISTLISICVCFLLIFICILYHPYKQFLLKKIINR